MQHFKKLRRSLGAAAAIGLLTTQQAFAAFDGAELEAAKADAIEAGTIVLGILVAIAAFKYIRRAL